MRKIAIVTDSNSGITQDEGRKLGIAVLPMSRSITKRLFRRRLHGLHILWHPAIRSAVCRILW